MFSKDELEVIKKACQYRQHAIQKQLQICNAKIKLFEINNVQWVEAAKTEILRLETELKAINEVIKKV